MLAFLTNIGLPELTVIAGLAVIIFGRRLPEVAAKAYGEVVRLRRTIERLRRETGIDRELRDIEFTVRDAARKAALKEPLPPPAEFRANHDRGVRGTRDEERSSEEDGSRVDDEASRGEPGPDQGSEATTESPADAEEPGKET